MALILAVLALTSPVPRCHTPGLHVYFAGSNGAAGRIEMDVVFRNISGHTCFVYGYAGFGLENARHRVLPSRVVWAARSPATTLGDTGSSCPPDARPSRISLGATSRTAAVATASAPLFSR